MRHTRLCRRLVPRIWLTMALALLITISVFPAFDPSNQPLSSNSTTFSQRSFYGQNSSLLSMVDTLRGGLYTTVHAQDEPIFNDGQCFAVADEPGEYDTLIEVDLTSGIATNIAEIEPSGQIEAISVVPDPVIPGQAIIYAADANVFGKLRIQGFRTENPRVLFDAIGGFGRASGESNAVTLKDVDGLTYDIKQDVMYGVHRRGQGKEDLLFIVDRNTGRFVPDYFNTDEGPADYVKVDIIDGLHDVDDIAIEPESRDMFGIINDNGAGGILVELDPATGHINEHYTIIDDTGQIVDDLEGIAFTSDGALYGSTGEHGPDKGDKNQLFEILLDTRNATTKSVWASNRAFFDKGADDVEGLGCLTTPPGDPAITVEKTTNGVDADEPGTGPEVLMSCPVVWDYTITNTGEIDLTSVQLSDDKLGPISCPSDALAANESMVCTVSGSATQVDYANLATVTAAASSVVISDTDPSHYTGIATSIVLEKSTNGQDADEAPGPMIPQGETVTWSYAVTNTSSVRLVDIVVTDDQIPSDQISCPANTLAPGESMSCSATGVAQADQYANIGTVTAMPENGCAPVTDTDPSHYFGTVPGITLEKFTNSIDADLPEQGPTLAVGCSVLWTYEISNTGNIDLNNLLLNDDQIGPISCPADSLPVGGGMTCSAPGIATEGQYANIGTVTALPKGTTTPLSATDPSHYNGILASIDIEKATASVDIDPIDADEAPGPSIQSGSAVTWTYTVVNTGALDLTDVTVVDDQVADVQCPQNTLTVGESMVCTAAGMAITGQYENTATVVANAVNACNPVTDSDPSHYFGILPDLDIAQTVVVNWSYSVTNTGQITLENVLVDGGPDVTISCPQETLAIDESMTCTATGPQERFDNTATVTANPEGLAIELVRTISATPITGLTVSVALDTAEGQSPTNRSNVGAETMLAVGNEATWRYTVSNSGTFAVEGISGQATSFLTGDSIPMICGQTVLAPNESMTCTVSLNVTEGRNGLIGTIIGSPAADGPTGAGLVGRTVSADAVTFYQGVQTATVGGRIFVDRLNLVGTANGRQDPGEENLLHVNTEIMIELYRYDGTVVQSGLSDTEGNYEFTGLMPDDYYLVAHRPLSADGVLQGFIWSEANQANNQLDSDVNAAWGLDSNVAQTEFFRLESGEADFSWDIGFQQFPLFGAVYVDANENGLQDEGEVGLPGVVINLSNESLSTTDVISITTNGAGIYDYGVINPSRYTIHVMPPPKYQSGPENPGEPDGPVGTNLSDGVNFALVPDNSVTIFLPVLTGTVTQGGK